jgi:hypothetical protein
MVLNDKYHNTNSVDERNEIKKQQNDIQKKNKTIENVV